ncbi:hypothetical protein AB4305_28435 [Nocardia sp. 2YAB30]|uniref:hypothetical protein n=1 Tax=unclassified Nocardia TaxID=2637762 RepID=UPI003F98F083
MLSDDVLRSVRAVTALDAAGITAARGLLTSYGSCSTTIPVAEANAFGLIDMERVSQ